MVEFDDLTEEQKAKALACKTTDELVALAKSLGVMLTEEQLEAMSGGSDWGTCYNNDC